MEAHRAYRASERERCDRERIEAREARLAREARHEQLVYTNRNWFNDQSAGVRNEIRLRAGHKKSEILRAEARRAAARRRSQVEADMVRAHLTRREEVKALHSAEAEESALRAQWEAAAAALEAQKAVVESAWAEENRLCAEFQRMLAAERSEQSEIPGTLVENWEEAAAAPGAIVVAEPTPTPTTEERDAPSEQNVKVTLAIEPPVVSDVATAAQSDITVVTPATEEPEAPLERKVKVGPATEEPEASSKRKVKVALATEEPEASLKRKVKVALRDDEALVNTLIPAEEPDAPQEQTVKAIVDDAVRATAFEEPKPPMEGRVKKAGVKAARISKPKAARSKAKKRVRFQLPGEPKPSPKGRERAVEEEVQEPEKVEHGGLTEEPETTSLQSSAGVTAPVVGGSDLSAALDAILAEEPKPHFEGRVKAETQAAQELVKGELALPEEPEKACPESVAEDEVSWGFDISAELDAIAAGDLLLLAEGGSEADDGFMDADDAPEAPQERMDADEDATMAAHEPELQLDFKWEDIAFAFEENVVMETAADNAAYEPEPQPSREDAAMETAAMDTDQPAAETSFEEEAEELSIALSFLSISDVELSREGDDVQMVGSLEDELSTALVVRSPAHLDDTFALLPGMAAQLALSADEPGLVEMTDLPADEPESEPMDLGEGQFNANGGEVFSRENDDPGFMDVEAPIERRGDNDAVMVEQGGLATTIREQIRLAQAHANQLAQLQAARQAEDWEAAQAQAALRRLEQETEAARLRAEEQARQRAWVEDQARMAEQLRLAHEAQVREQARIQEQARLAEEAMIQEQARALEQAMLEEQARRQEQARLEEEGRLAEKARIEEQQRLQEQARIAEQARLEEQARLQEQARAVEEGRRLEQARVEEEARRAEEARRWEMPAEERAMEDQVRRQLVEAMLRAGMRDVFPVPRPPPRPDSENDDDDDNSTIVDESDRAAGRFGLDLYGSDDEDTSLNSVDLAIMGVPVGWHNPDDSDDHDSLFDGELSDQDDEEEEVAQVVRDEEGAAWVVRNGLSFPLPTERLAQIEQAKATANNTPSAGGDTMPSNTDANTLPTGADITSSAGGQVQVPIPGLGNTTTTTTTPTTLSAVPSAPEFAFRADQQPPTRLERLLQAKPAPAGAAGPSQPAARKILPARGTKVSKEARQRVLTEFKGNLVQGAEDQECELLDDEDLAGWIAEQEDIWAAETVAEQATAAEADPKGKGKAVEPTKAEKRAAARAKALAEFKEIEERRLQSGQEVQRAFDSYVGHETVFRPLYMGEEAQFDPRVTAAAAVARDAFVMGQAAQQARLAAQKFGNVVDDEQAPTEVQKQQEEEEIISDEDEDEVVAGPSVTPEQKAAAAAEEARQQKIKVARARIVAGIAAGTIPTPAPGSSAAKRDLDNVGSDSEADEDDMDDDRARTVRINRGADKRADKPETDGKALALFSADMPPAIAFKAQPPAGTVFAEEKPFVPPYPLESFSNGGRESSSQLATMLGRNPEPEAASASSTSSALVPSTPMAITSSNTPSRPDPAAATPPSRKRSQVTCSVQSKKQKETPTGPSLAEQAAELEKTKGGASSTPGTPSAQRTPPTPGTVIRATPTTPSLFISQKRKKPAPKK